MSEDTNGTNPKLPSVDRLPRLWRRINEHKMVQWSVAYVALAYAIQHGVTLTSDAFDWPHAVVRVSMLLLVLGLPLVMTLAWYHGERASRRISGPELTIVSVLLVMSSLLFYAFVRPSGEVATAPKSAVQQAGVAAARSASLNPGSAISIAVLPFANVSGDATQEFFSDGMTDEIIAALAKVPSLQVVARTSAFQFKGEKKDMRAIGQALNARYLIDGSVRKAGDRVRITAQLVESDNGVGVWTESYDRDLKDIFATQSDIAQAIAVALKVPLRLQQSQRLVSNRTINLESYDEYLRGRTLYRSRAIADAIAVLEPVVASNSGFAPAWAVLAEAYLLAPGYDASSGVNGSVVEMGRLDQSAADKAEKAARQAIRLDSENATAIAALGDVEYVRGRWAAAEDFYKMALALDPDDPDVLLRYVMRLGQLGRYKVVLPLARKLRALEPFVPAYNIFTSISISTNGQMAEAIAMVEAVPAGAAGGFFRNEILALFYAHEGRFREAADTLLAITPRQNMVSREAVENAARLIRGAPLKVKSPENLPPFDALSWFYFYVGAPDRMLDSEERALEARALSTFVVPWLPEMAPLRKMERFKALMRKAGIVDYWRERGWPDFCRPMGSDDFACD